MQPSSPQRFSSEYISTGLLSEFRLFANVGGSLPAASAIGSTSVPTESVSDLGRDEVGRRFEALAVAADDGSASAGRQMDEALERLRRTSEPLDGEPRAPEPPGDIPARTRRFPGIRRPS